MECLFECLSDCQESTKMQTELTSSSVRYSEQCDFDWQLFIKNTLTETK